ncbi:MOSC N-terminal beta barrel domain-containing protein [Quadrisphaera sp. DSM 44207]|uniref:MOSC N-terminal beta barrel domain-containing protein n=1 Tax=Quadrisphaera sp. DSM 44207 TaxID=1881057 RepID=UPI00088474F2|nr:MOSC N-terminal beta barrel domain-containing protein [Quadrisphaera sp. DSM 44207]SDQ48675.1 hypothetical protein SAMN05428996_1893 [Quadrisphaera sp. DSM 44207]
MRVGTVSVLRRFPLRSAAGEQPAEAVLDAGGLVGDRRWEVVDAGGQVLTGKQLPSLAGVRAEVGRDGLVAVVDGVRRGGADLGAALSALAGRPVSVRDSAAGGGPHREGAAVHVISAGAALAPDAPTGCDPGTRANVVLALDAPGEPAVRPGAERGWEGARLRVGEAELLLTRTPRRCLGIYADVVVPGRVRTGDDAVLLG